MRRRVRGRSLPGYEVERAVRPVGVVVVDEDAKHMLEAPSVQNQEPVEALSANGADEALIEVARGAAECGGYGFRGIVSVGRP